MAGPARPPSDTNSTPIWVGGTRAHFTELNRQISAVPPEVPALSFSITPQMHATEIPHLVDSVGVQRTAGENALRLADGRPVFVGPVTLARRFNAVATTEPSDPSAMPDAPSTPCSRPTPAERRDDQAADRDDAAEGCDTAARDRDTAATSRDSDAHDRDGLASQHPRDLDERLRQVCQQILDRLAWAENTTINPADWPDLTPAALDRLRAHAAEQRRLTALDRAIASSLLSDLRAQLDRGRAQLRTAADDRRAAASDRLASDQDRRSAAQDRDNSTRDRGQAALEREQADPRNIVAAQQTATGVDDSLTDRTARSVAESRQRIAAAAPTTRTTANRPPSRTIRIPTPERLIQRRHR